jgi:hypothetical protein
MAVSRQGADISHDDVTSSRDAPVPQAAIAAAVRDAAARATVAVGLGTIAVIHAVAAVGKWTEARYMGVRQHKPKRCDSRLEMAAANCGLPLPRRWQVKVASAS